MEMTSFVPEYFFEGVELLSIDTYRKTRFPSIAWLELRSVERK